MVNQVLKYSVCEVEVGRGQLTQRVTISDSRNPVQRNGLLREQKIWVESKCG